MHTHIHTHNARFHYNTVRNRLCVSDVDYYYAWIVWRGHQQKDEAPQPTKGSKEENEASGEHRAAERHVCIDLAKMNAIAQQYHYSFTMHAYGMELLVITKLIMTSLGGGGGGEGREAHTIVVCISSTSHVIINNPLAVHKYC